MAKSMTFFCAPETVIQKHCKLSADGANGGAYLMKARRDQLVTWRQCPGLLNSRRTR